MALGQDLPCDGQHAFRIHVADDAQHHVRRVVEGSVAGVEGLGRDLGNALHRAGDGDVCGALFVQTAQQVRIDAPVGRVLGHADLLGDDAALFVDALLSKIGNRDKGEQDAQVFLKMLGAVEVIRRHGIAGEGVWLGSVLRKLLQRVAVLGVEHLVLEIVGDAGGRIVPGIAQLELHVHAAVARGEKGIGAAVAGLWHDGNAQPVFQCFSQHGFTDARIVHFMHSLFPPPRAGNTRCPASCSVRRRRCARPSRRAAARSAPGCPPRYRWQPGR